MKAILPYPGSKSTHRDWLVPWIQSQWRKGMEYREPFVGAGGSLLPVVHWLLTQTDRPKVWINDADDGIACLWRSVLDQPEELAHRVMSGSVDRGWAVKFLSSRFVSPDDNPPDVLRFGFARWVVSYAGHAGTADSSGAHRRRVQRLTFHHRILDAHQLLKRCEVKISCGDFGPVVRRPGRSLVYADPPYPLAGGRLYRHDLCSLCHARLAGDLISRRSGWVLSYGDRDQRTLRPYKRTGFSIFARHQPSRIVNKKTGYKELVVVPQPDHDGEEPTDMDYAHVLGGFKRVWPR